MQFKVHMSSHLEKNFNALKNKIKSCVCVRVCVKDVEQMDKVIVL